MNFTAINLIKSYEGCKLTSYQDSGGVWTIGWGSTGSDIKSGLVWSQQQADDRLAKDVQFIEDRLAKIIRRPLSQQSLASLDSLAYNIGVAAISSSHLLSCVNAGDDIGATKAFLTWDHIGQDEAKGLLIRRLDEAVTYLRGV